jgi:hypothetical protein
MKEKAELVGVSAQTLSKYVNRPEFWEQMSKDQDSYLMTMRGAIDQSLILKALDGNPKALELYYKLTGKLDSGLEMLRASQMNQIIINAKSPEGEVYDVNLGKLVHTEGEEESGS